MTTIKLRRGTAAEWEAALPVLADGEFAVETDTGKFKIGREGLYWDELPYGTFDDQDIYEFLKLFLASGTGIDFDINDETKKITIDNTVSTEQNIKLLLGTASSWATNNPILNAREWAKETDTGIIKAGDGVTHYNSLVAYVPRQVLLLAPSVAVPAGTPAGTLIFRKTT